MRNLSPSTDSSVEYNLNLGRLLFSNPICQRHDAVVAANHPDFTAGIDTGDLLRVDFTQNTIGDGGLYIITIDDGWIGLRFFERRPSLHMRDSNESYPVTPSMLKSIKVVGRVIDIYQSRNKEA